MRVRPLLAALLAAAALGAVPPAGATDPATLTLTGRKAFTGKLPVALRGEITVDTDVALTMGTATMEGTYLMLVVTGPTGDITAATTFLPGWHGRTRVTLKFSPRLAAGRNVVTALSNGAFSLPITADGLPASQTLDLATTVGPTGVAAIRHPLTTAGDHAAADRSQLNRDTNSLTFFANYAELSGTTATPTVANVLSLAGVETEHGLRRFTGVGGPGTGSATGITGVAWPVYGWPSNTYRLTSVVSGGDATIARGELVLLSVPLDEA
jgi:hypothetical protein